jgi:hypothetical protein
MNLEELLEWQAYYAVEPWGESLNGLRSASITAAAYNSGLMVADPKRFNKKPFQPSDFFVGVEPSVEKKKPGMDDTWKIKQQMLNVIAKVKK